MFFNIIFISLLIFSIWWLILFMNSLDMARFGFLNIFKITPLSSLSSKLSIQFLRDSFYYCFSPLHVKCTFLFLCMSPKFSLKTGYFKWYSLATLEIRFSPHSRFVIVPICLVTLVNQCSKACTLCQTSCGHWSLCPASLVVRNDGTRSFEHLKPSL